MGTITYNADRIDLDYIYRATNGGTVFSSNLAGLTAFDYFTDTAQVGDCIYFGNSGTQSFSNLYLTVGTPANANWTLVWEYWKGSPSPAEWRTMHDLTDGSNGFTTSGTVNFPLQANSYYCVVNGLPNTYMWVRCRIASLTSITEGGANATNKVKRSNGQLRIESGYTEASPCTWTELYNWVLANAPEIGAYKWGNSAFKFDNCSIIINSPTRSRNEMVFFGNGCYYQIYYFNYLISGDKVGTNGWSNPSYYFISTHGPTGLTTFTNAKIYGGAFTTQQFTNVVDGLVSPNTGYVSVGSGEHIGVYYNQSGYFGSAVADRCMFNGGIITSATPTVYPTNMQFANPANILWNLYGVDLNVSDFAYSLPASAIIGTSGNYGNDGWNNTVNLKNPSPALPLQKIGAPRLFNRTIVSLSNLSKFYYYDASAGTYTDYTTQASDNTADDVPFYGDVGDMFYMQVSSSVGATSYQAGFSIIMANQTNDYQYAIEYWNTTSWLTMPSDYIFDNTNNFSQTGKLYLNTKRTLVATTVNGVNGKWVRVRIIGKGSTTPKITRIYQQPQHAIGNWRINEIYTTSWKVQDENGNPIQDATITISDSDNTANTYTTGALGTIADIDLKVKYSYFDKNVSEALYNTATKDLSPFIIKVKKNGYETYSEALNIAAKLDKTVTLKKDIPNMIDTDGNLYPKLNVANDGAFRDMVIDGEIIL